MTNSGGYSRFQSRHTRPRVTSLASLTQTLVAAFGIAGAFITTVSRMEGLRGPNDRRLSVDNSFPDALRRIFFDAPTIRTRWS